MSAAEAIEQITIGPQKGPQEMFLSSKADIAIFGGAAGGGKTWAIVAEPLRHVTNDKFAAYIFRRTTKQIKTKGGLWDEANTLYSQLGAVPRMSSLDWKFFQDGKKGMSVQFAHLEHEKTVFEYQGAQIPFMGFDELTHFTEHQFFYMMSRLRSMSGVPGYVRATCNPDADSWVRHFLDWWIDKDGYAIPERSGVLRWFIRINDEIVWADKPEDLKEMYGDDQLPRSVTFIPSKLADNKILMQQDPTYLAALRSLPKVDRERLLGDPAKGGNWNVRPGAGTIFRKEWFQEVDTIPKGFHKVVRFWDRAASTPTPDNRDPDWTRGVKLYCYPDGTFVVGDLRSLRGTPGQVDMLIKRTAEIDTIVTRIGAQQDPGSAGVLEATHFTRLLAAFDVRTRTFSKDKVTRAKPVSAAAEFGRIKVLKAVWNAPFYAELTAFPDGAHDDIVDALSGAYNEVADMGSTADVAARAANG
jgi:predicted phage terminase large subunit-like protein